LDKGREEAFLEHARFENGMFEGRFHDPTKAMRGEVPEVHPPEHHDWLRIPLEEMSPKRQRAACVLFGLNRALRQFRGGLQGLFAAENLGLRQENKGGSTGVLEPIEFLRGLVRVGAVQEGNFTLEDVFQVMQIIDPGSDGRVRLPVVARAVAVARSVTLQRERDLESFEQLQDKRSRSSYHAKLPVEAVKVDKIPSSMLNFDRSFANFRSQQQNLLNYHEKRCTGSRGSVGLARPQTGLL